MHLFNRGIYFCQSCIAFYKKILCNSVCHECVVAIVLYCIVNDNVIYSYLVYLLMYICFWICVLLLLSTWLFFAIKYYFFDEFNIQSDSDNGSVKLRIYVCMYVNIVTKADIWHVALKWITLKELEYLGYHEIIVKWATYMNVLGVKYLLLTSALL
jgi:hypothetical protein